MSTPKKFYLTTPIYYVNARPHIGHAYSTIVADVIARRHRLLGDDTYFLTGTDEHGQKIERSAAAAGVPPQEFADQVSETFSSLWKRMGITNDDFIRTTSERHKRGVQKLFATLQANDAIYLDTYTGQYCVSDEAYVEVGPGEPCPDCGRITETISESNYYFKLSDYQKSLMDLIESDELEIKPESRKNEVLTFLGGRVADLMEAARKHPSCPDIGTLTPRQAMPMLKEMGLADQTALGRIFVKGHLKDLSISRTSFKWGIPVPGDEAHVIYVWLDALANYMTAVGYGFDAPEDIAKFERYWPADLHLVGKEIIRFHCVYWPAFLLALRPPTPKQTDGSKWAEEDKLAEAEWIEKWLPKSIVANGWLLFEDSKMSKSRGNVVRTETILDAFGSLCPSIPQPLSSFAPQTLSSFAEGGGSAVPPEAPQSFTPTKQQQDLFATDVLRYFLLREIPFGQDGSFSFDALVIRYNADLANGYGNLVSRTLSMIGKFCNATIPEGPDVHVREGWGVVEGLYQAYGLESLRCLESYEFARAIEFISTMVTITDRFLSGVAPWKIAANAEATREDKQTVPHSLYFAAESIRIITALLYPILPYATASVWSQLGLGDIEAAAKRGDLKDLKWGGLQPGTKLGALSPIFPRADKGLIQTMIDTEERNAQEAAAAKSKTSLIDEKSPTAAENHAPTDPAAAPRTSSLPVEDPGAHVAASAAITTERPGTPPHHEAPASAPFANAAAASAIPDTPQIAIDDFVKIDLRVAKIVVAERIPKADKLLRLEVDLGYEKRQILSGIAEWYTPEELIGRTIVVIANLAPRKMRGLESHGMLLAASHGENGKPVLATFGEEIALGSRLR